MRVVSRVHGLDVDAPFAVGTPIADRRAIDWTIDVADELSEIAFEAAPAGPVVAAPEGDEPFYSLHQTGSDQFVFRFSGLGDVDIDIDTIGRSATWRLLPTGDRSRVPVLTAGTLLATLCMLDGHLTLHASAIEHDGAAVAFVAGSGAGKSTLAALACIGGALLVTDDVLRVDVVGGSAVCYRGAPSIRLRSGSRVLPAGVTVSSTSADQRLIMSPPTCTADTLPLAGILIPRLDGTVTTIQRRPLDAHGAALELLGSPRVFGWKHSTAALLFEQLMDLAAIVPVSELAVPRHREFTQDDADRLIDLLF